MAMPDLQGYQRSPKMITNVDCKIPSFLLTQKVFNFDNFSINSYKQENAQFTFAEEPQKKPNSLKTKTLISNLNQTKLFKGTIVNRALASLKLKLQLQSLKEFCS